MNTSTLTEPGTSAAGTKLRSAALADRLERGAEALAALTLELADDAWTTAIPHDGRTVGVVIHHVASVYPVEIHLAQVLASGEPVTGVTMDDVHQMNAKHAVDHRQATRAETLLLLRENSQAAAAAIRALTDEELDRAAPASLYDDAPITCQFMLEDHAVRHSYHHLAVIQRTLAKNRKD